tara:strand:- start:10192 stop:10791 length:600 start_codon:yes stop_codon:yes gene_type:complete
MNILLNKFLYFKAIILAITILSATESEKNITDEQKKQIEALTNDMLMAPEFELNSMDQDGKKYKLSDLKGKVVILNFWATWCGPCRMEIPDFNELYLENKDKGLIILGISTDDTKRGLTNFLKSYKVEYPILFGSNKQISKISNEYGGIRALPTSIIIDANGEIKRIYPSAILKNYTPDIYSSFIYDVQTALKSIDEKK